MRTHPILVSFYLSALTWIACGQDPSTQSNPSIGSAGMGAGASAVGTPAPSAAAGHAAGAAAISGGARAGAGGVIDGAAGMTALAGTPGRAAAGAGGMMRAPSAGAPAAISGRGGAGGASAAAGAVGAAGQPSTSGTDYAPCPSSGACKILPLGDSITYGIGYDGGYRVELFRKAHSGGKQITFTGSLSNGPSMVDGVSFPKNNEGHSGWKIDQLLPLIPMPALQTPPNIVLLMIGTNDIAQNDDLSNAPKRLGGLLDKLAMNAPDALIVVAKLTPLRQSMGVQTYNAAIPAIVDERAAAGKHVLLIDQFTGFPTSELGDGVHPNQQGYERMASVWYEAIGKFLH